MSTTSKIVENPSTHSLFPEVRLDKMRKAIWHNFLYAWLGDCYHFFFLKLSAPYFLCEQAEYFLATTDFISKKESHYFITVYLTMGLNCQNIDVL